MIKPVSLYRLCCAAAALLAAILFSAGASSVQATTIERVVSSGGIEAWLVREPAVPMIAVEFAFLGGANQDPQDKPGVANLATDLMDEAAGPYDSKTFHDLLERKAIELTFRTSRDYTRGTLRTLKDNRDEAFEYLRLALTAPRFDKDDVERVRAQMMSRLRRETTNPNDIASRRWWEAAFPGHPYGRPVNGTLESVPHITGDDLKGYVGRVLARQSLKVAIVGDIDAGDAKRLLDHVFGGLPDKPKLETIANVMPAGLGRRIVVQLDVPQAVVNFGGPGIPRKDPDFMAAYIVNHILGGGSFSSRLYREVREKRGLAYGVYGSLLWFNHAAVLLGTTATRGDRTGQTIEIIESEIRRLAAEGPTETELAEAKSYLKGSFALGLDTSGKIASQLIQMQLDELGIDYIDRRSAIIDAVTLGDAKRVAKRLLNAGLLMTVVGRPEGVVSKEGG